MGDASRRGKAEEELGDVSGHAERDCGTVRCEVDIDAKVFLAGPIDFYQVKELEGGDASSWVEVSLSSRR